jgi:hypothetical protein
VSSADDNGPGTFAYPTDGAFHAGAFDLIAAHHHDALVPPLDGVGDEGAAE